MNAAPPAADAAAGRPPAAGEATAVAARRWPAWLLSLWCHAAVLAALALARYTPSPPPAVSTLVTFAAESDDSISFLPVLTAPETGSPPPTMLPPSTPASVVEAPSVRPVVAAAAPAAPAKRPSDEPPSGTGTGSGHSGDGSGELPAFLDGSGAGRRLVYVVDCSKSMRKPFPSPERNRLGRVKRELITSIGSLSSDQRFSIVFFNDSAYPLPGGYLGGGLSGVEHVRDWIDRVRGGGQTDPEAALLHALSLRPDAVFFLTDGDFKKSTVDRVVELNRLGTRVHTIGFGDDIAKRHPDSRRRTGPTLAEYLLTDLARRTGGTVKFIATEMRTAAR